MIFSIIYHLCLLLMASLEICGIASATSPMESTGLQILKQRKADARMSRISTLLTEGLPLSDSNQKELNSLMKTDTYDSNSFSECHRLFKAEHNKVFATLGKVMKDTYNI